MKPRQSQSTSLKFVAVCLAVAAISEWSGTLSDRFLPSPAFFSVARPVAHQDAQSKTVPWQADNQPFSFIDGTVTCTLPEIRGGSLILIGSTDTNAGLHSIQIEAGGSPHGITTAAAELVPEFHRACSLDETISSNNKGEYSANAQGEYRPDVRRSFDPPDDAGTSTGQSVDAVSIPPSHRRFFAPIFSSATASCRPVIGSLINYSQHVAVYADQVASTSGTATDHGAAIKQKAVQVCSISEQLLPILALSLGEVADVDADGRVTFLLTSLNQGQNEADPFLAAAPPIQGCVRRDDFAFAFAAAAAGAKQSETEFDAVSVFPVSNGRHYGSQASVPANSDGGGDIVYLDLNLPATDDLVALLMHELTHAVVYSIRMPSNTASSLPVWLNESTAHLMELSVSRHSANYRDRWPLYRAAPHLHPVVIPSHGTTLATRRGGSRIAGTEFLRSLNPDKNDLRKLLAAESSIEQSIEDVFGISFDQAFRRWCILQATNPNLQSPNSSLHDVASAEPGSPSITSDTLTGRQASSHRSPPAHSTRPAYPKLHVNRSQQAVIPDQPALRSQPIAARTSTWQLRGTAFLCLHAESEVTGLTIRANRRARLQVTILDGTP